jgi:hypothetical protein
MRVLLLPLLLLASLPAHAAQPCLCGPDLSGNWPNGRWESQSDGHGGPLSATFERVDAQHYRVVFRGKFLKIIPFRYNVTLDIVGQQGDRVLLAGSSKLPIFGTFTYDAQATACEFMATYSSRADKGTFRLHR